MKQLPWTEGGRLAPGFKWEGGKDVVYEPGDTVTIDDREVGDIWQHLDAIDGAGRAVLKKARKEAAAPASNTAVADLDPRTIDWLTRDSDERLRRDGHLRQLCLRIIARNDDPRHEDLADALVESPEPPPQELLRYVEKLLRGEWRKSGRKAPPRTTEQDLFVQSLYHIKVEELQVKFARQRQKRPPVKRRAAEEVAAALQLSVRAVERIVAPLPWTKTRRKGKQTKTSPET